MVRINDEEAEMEEPYYYQTTNANQQQILNIDPCSEQEFPSLAGRTTGPNVSLTRPPPPAMLNRSRMSGLACTKENFPALGGSGNNSVTAAPAASNRAPPPISNVIKKPPTSATGAIPRNNVSNNLPSTSTNGMVIHVSNRPSSTAGNNNSSALSKKANAMDFPALPASKTKKNAAKVSALEEDMPTSGVQMPISSVPAKHRSLVDDYVSVANSANFQKIQMVKKEERETIPRKEPEAKNAPKLTTQDFPSLGGVSAAKANAPNTWIKSTLSEKKQKDIENRKNKIAPAPLLQSSNIDGGSLKQTNIANGNSQGNASNKKDKKPKDKKNKETSKNNNNNNENKASNNSVMNGSNKQSPLRPPPGFQNSTSIMKPPPGFQSTNVTVNSVAKSPNNLTFTSSLGESYSILPTHSYAAPVDALARNQVCRFDLS